MKHQSYIQISQDELGQSYQIPYLEIKGSKKGKTITLTAGIHGDEVNSQKIIFDLFHQIDPKDISGTIRFFPTINIPGYKTKSRFFTDNVDLNHIMDGKGATKFPSSQYIKELLPHIFKTDILLDLHSDRAGLTNCAFAYADLKSKPVAELAQKLTVDAIISHKPSARTLRGVCAAKKITCITIETGDSLSYDKELTDQVREGLQAILTNKPIKTKPLIFKKSTWQTSDVGGYTTLIVKPKQKVRKGQAIGTTYDLVGNITKIQKAAQNGFVLVVAKNPVLQKGDKLIHIATKE